jgi:hypothetical protein
LRPPWRDQKIILDFFVLVEVDFLLWLPREPLAKEALGAASARHRATASSLRIVIPFRLKPRGERHYTTPQVQCLTEFSYSDAEAFKRLGDLS